MDLFILSTAQASRELVEASRGSLSEINDAINNIRSCSDEILQAISLQGDNFTEVENNFELMNQYFNETLQSGQLTFTSGLI